MAEYIGPYRLVNMLRFGKTCRIWEAASDARAQRFALKVLMPEFRNNKDEVFYLRHEHQVGQKLNHPRVIRIYEFGADREFIYLVMDLYYTPNLKQWIQQGVEKLFPTMRAIIEQAAEGLAYFHTQHWVHRDIKPDNFLLKADEGVKLIDFALAVRPKRGLAKWLPSRRTKIQGTRSYMSPEQIRGKPIDERADIYSFGCMVHELLGGRPPFTGTSTNDLLNKHLSSPAPSVQSSNRNVTDAFAQLIKRTLAKSPADRPNTMYQFLTDFRALEIFKEPPKPAPAPK